MVETDVQNGAEHSRRGLVGEEGPVLHLHVVVVGHRLLLGSGDGVVVLELALGLAELHHLLEHRVGVDGQVVHAGEREVELGHGQLVHGATVQSLGAAATGVVAGPVGVGVGGVGHEVALVDVPHALVGVHGLDVVGEDGVLHVHAEAVLVVVHVLDQLVHVVVGDGGAEEVEVAAPGDEQVVAVVVVGGSGLHHVHERLRLLLRVHLERGQVRVVLEPHVVLLAVHAVAAAVAEEVALRGRAVVVVHHVDEHVALLALAVAAAPHELQLLVLDAVRLVRVVHSVDAERIHTDVSVQRLDLLGVAEGVDGPAHSGTHAKLVVDELGTQSHLVDHIFVGGRSLVRHDPATQVELELAIVHKLVDQSLHVGILLVPPSLEEPLLNITTCHQPAIEST